MKNQNLISLVKNIVDEAKKLKDNHTDEKSAPVNYACIFSQNKTEYQDLMNEAEKIGEVLRETKTGNIYKIDPLETPAGLLKILKIRKPDKTRPEKGDADFTVSDYQEFKKKYLSKVGFKLIERPNMEMIELIDPDFDVRAYFSNPPLDQQFGL